MNSMEDQYGFDANFISEVPEYLKCIVCHLVLRQPIQIMKCGHRFCTPCFERIKGYSQQMNTILSCPIDREAIDLNKVFEDTGMARVVGDLQVKCANVQRECSWTGDLRDLQTHADQCQHRLIKCLHNESNVQGIQVDSALFKELCRRVGKCEDAMTEKEKDVAFLKYNLHELKKSLSEKEEEVDLFKVKKINIENEMKLMKEQSLELRKHFEMKTENLNLKNQLLENKIDLLGNQFLDLKKLLENEQTEIIAMKSETEEVKNKLSEKLNSTQKEIEKVKTQFNKSLDLNNSSINNEVKKLEDKVNNANNEIRAARTHADKSFTKKTDEITKLSARVATSEKAIKDNFNTLNNEIKKQSEDINLKKDYEEDINKALEKVDNLESHVTNIENILFCDTSIASKDIVLQWKLQNYQYHFDLGKDVYSPTFFTQIRGYCFKLYIEWTGEKKANLELGLKLCRGSSYVKALKPFDMQYSLQIIKNKEINTSREITLAEIEAHRVGYFTLHPGENESRLGHGRFIRNVQDYIVNDMLLMQCTLTP